jgi:ATP-dependent protease ClpP protease subunit
MGDFWVRRAMRAMVCCLAALVVAASASADRVVMKDGRIFEGTITKETRTSVTIDAVVANIPTTMTLSKRDIDSIEKGPAPAAPSSEPTSTPARETTRDTRRGRAPSPDRRAAPGETTRYIVIPIHGVFGEDIAPPGVADAIQFAARRNIDHVVFHIDSPGGYTWAADAIAEAMEDAPESMRLIAYIEDAISASIWVVFGCDEIFVAPGAAIGAAVTYSQDNTTGATEVDQKLNSALAAKIAGMAERKGVSGVIARAMFLPEAEAYAVERAPGEYDIVDRHPGGRDGVSVIDGADTVLTLTGEEAIKWGLARPAEGIDKIGAALGLEGWTKHNDYGEAAMRKAGEALARGEGNVPMKIERLTALARSINAAIHESRSMAPEDGLYYVHPESGLFTPESQDLWQERTDASIAAIQRALDRLGEYTRTKDELKALGVDVGASDINLNDSKESLQRRIDELRRNRNKRYV